MHRSVGVSLLATVIVLLLSGCGDSHPLPQSPPAESAPAAGSASAGAVSGAAAAYVPATGAFAPETSALAQSGTRAVDDCNVDSIDGKPVDGVSLMHGSTAKFAGWAADSATGVVPKHVRVVLRGERGSGSFSIEVATGETRTDVAQAHNMPALATAGWAVQANLSAVAPGRYGVVLVYRIDSKPVMCDPRHVVTIR